MVLTKAIFHVHGGSSTLQDTEGLDDSLRHTVLRLVNVEVAQRAVLTQSAPSKLHHISSSFRLRPYRWVWAPQYLSPGTCHETQIRYRAIRDKICDSAALTWISPKASLSVRLSAAYTRSKRTSAIALQPCFSFLLSPLFPRPMRTYHSAGGSKCSLAGQRVQGLKTRELLESAIGRRRAQSTTASDRSGGTSSESQSRAGNCGGAGARGRQRRSHGAHRGSGGGGGGGSHHDSTEASVDRRGSCRGSIGEVE